MQELVRDQARVRAMRVRIALEGQSGEQKLQQQQEAHVREIEPTVKTTIGIPRVQKVSRSTSVVTKPTSENSVLSKEEATPRSSAYKRTESISCEQNLETSISNFTAKGKKSGRRRSYASLLIESTKLLKDHENVTNEEILPEIYDDCNQLEVAEYVDEIYQHYSVTEVVGTKGYAAPEYVQTGPLTSEVNVWSYGIFLEELIIGQLRVARKH